ncbi:hypothetical protein KY317_00635 [Candidatus Woesearchaeota archaeon]|nr:hypothetical protein [Candidatus Woesearchaeota archaeon]
MNLKKSDLKEKARQRTGYFLSAVRKNTAIAIMAAFAFIIALVWRDAIQEGINSITRALNIPQDGYIFHLLAAIIVTIVCVIGILIFSKWAEKK